jgi:hypothetical protein
MASRTLVRSRGVIAGQPVLSAGAFGRYGMARYGAWTDYLPTSIASYFAPATPADNAAIAAAKASQAQAAPLVATPITYQAIGPNPLQPSFSAPLGPGAMPGAWVPPQLSPMQPPTAASANAAVPVLAAVIGVGTLALAAALLIPRRRR